MKDKLSIQDLAMFIGCKVQYEEEEDLFECTLIGVDINSEYDSIFLKGPSAILSCRPENVKPILRLLSDMTEEEIMELYDLAGYNREDICKPEDLERGKVIKKRQDEISVAVWVETSVEYNEADIYAVHIKMGSIVDHMGYPPNNWREVFVWFIRKQFDVFGWIPKGLVIDKTKL